MARVFKVRVFNRWMKKAGLSDEALSRAVFEMEQGLIDAELGLGLVKKRVALPGHGKRGGAHTLVATNKKGRWVFLYGFQKNEKENISTKELATLQELSSDFMCFSEADMNYAVSEGELLEVSYEEKNK